MQPLKTDKKEEPIESRSFREYYGHYQDFVKMLTLLSGAIIPVILTVTQHVTPTPTLLKYAVLGNLISFLAGLACLQRKAIDPLAEFPHGIRQNIETLANLRESGIAGLSEWRFPTATERVMHGIQKLFFVLALIPMVIYLLAN